MTMEQNVSKKAKVSLTLKQSYILALSLILLLAIVKYAAMESMIKTQDSAAVVINMSGRQRMLSQRIALFANIMVAEGHSQKERQAARASFNRTLEEFQSNHNALINGDPERQIPVLENANILDIYQDEETGLDSLVKQYIEAGHAILSDNSNKEAALSFIMEVGPNTLLQQLNEIVILHEKNAIQDVQNIRDFQTVFFILTVICLILEALYIFRPMVHKIKKNIAELEHKEEIIKSQLLEMERFTYVASHDLQEPLRKVRGFIDRLEENLEGKLDEKGRVYMGFITSSAEYMSEQVRGLRRYAAVTAAPDTKEEIDSAKVVKQIIKKLETKIELTKTTINVEKLPVVYYSHNMLMQVFENLIVNAITYKSLEDPVINISADKNKSEWVFCVSDNGIGIEKQYFERIFMLFHRLHRKEDIPGIGLGLAIVKKIIERHGGKVWVESKFAQGTKFFFTVPDEK